MKNRHTVIPRSLIIIFNKNKQKVLLIKGQPKKPHWADTYNALGGHIEAGESVYESAQREVEEESGLTLNYDELRLAGLIHVKDYHDNYAMMFLFMAVVGDVKIKSSYEGKVEWVEISKIKSIEKIAQDIKQLVPLCKLLQKGQTIFGISEFNHDTSLKFFKVDVY